MAEYIDREAAQTSCRKYSFAESYDAFAVDCILKAIPAADVAPVRHGRWVDNHCTACGMMPMGDEMWKLCDFEPPRFEKFMDSCQSCGAKMDGGVDDACL